MNELAAILKREIAANGPITIARYMAEALLHPRHGYYTTRMPFGASGDFTTAPEISQMFGELIGLWCASEWQSMGAPTNIALVELGPGRGTLMHDMLRAASALPPFRAALRPYLVEASPQLCDLQKSKLAGTNAVWLDDFVQVPQGPLILVANEFFDALPIHQYERHGEGWRERLVTVDANGHFSFVLRPQGLPLAQFGSAPEGSVKEDCPAARAVVSDIAARLAAHGGAALVIDYGHAGGFGDTLQAVRRHRFADVLEQPGEQDITAHVDFSALAEEAAKNGCVPFGPIGQGAFLESLGIQHRASRLKQNARPEQAEAIDTATRRLTAADAMGTLFKVMALRPQGRAAAPAGFGS